MNSIQFQLLH